VKSRSDENTPYRDPSPGKDIDHVMISEVDRRKEESTDDGEKEVEERPCIAVG